MFHKKLRLEWITENGRLTSRWVVVAAEATRLADRAERAVA